MNNIIEFVAEDVLFFDIIFGLRNSESWSKFVPHCDDRKVNNVSIAIMERNDKYKTNSLYCEWLEYGAREWFILEFAERFLNDNE